ncbi:hypothetical protein [Iningainema tapete]|uniref:Uncharacterized protein n=1 Tax=Iningainema tapete BLCC-T55 TaxID=2748662 RepID=A0A8J6XJE6_9CYAN|nr:hypothetical protein [Iningainema tapete]MBD2775613.1 hypothetical protein [Iningainema tapete BLCC-T55]
MGNVSQKPTSTGFEPKLTPDDFDLDESGNLFINTSKVIDVMNYQAINIKREPLKGGVSPI